jgi:hypothetical protein
MMQTMKMVNIFITWITHSPIRQSYGTLDDGAEVYYILSHAKISRGFVKNSLKITSETKEWQKSY